MQSTLSGFMPNIGVPRLCAYIEDNRKIDCGFPGMTKQSCLNKACCYNDNVSGGVPWCFKNYPGMCISLLSASTSMTGANKLGV